MAVLSASRVTDALKPSLFVLLLLLEQLTKVVSYFIRSGCHILVICSNCTRRVFVFVILYICEIDVT